MNKNTNFDRREENERTRLGCGVSVFTPKGVRMTELQAEAMDVLCRQVQTTVAPVRSVNWNVDREQAGRLHNIVINLSFDNRALEKD